MLRDLFTVFIELPEEESSKPFLEHLEDLRWTIVKMAIALLISMVLFLAFRTTLVHVLQAPLASGRSADWSVAPPLGITDSITISFRLAFFRRVVLSFPILLYFLAEFVLPALTAVEKTLFASGDFRKLRASFLSA